ncbi:LemA family protein [Akkermansia glycaniphila]|uniref:Lema family n=1 Tax=Akkermansia glycaniphila TaxID=1679444 RepID=A0A1C7P8L0_9BACT|nr:LemA family protein [Akkermansia glycaniphila]MBT9450551.1 LemA family protein [Akkermansia glycaniphila]OCA01917.1 LemA [Akkermansia glycaniphila]SEH91871.1 lema family [Akkermansia glycaniphila]
MDSYAVYVVIGVLVLALFWAIGSYNALVSLRNEVRSSFANIDVKLQRRYDLIPNLVATAKRYMQHERETLEAVTAARNTAAQAAKAAAADPANAEAMRSLVQAEGSLGATLGRLFAVSEAYPDLKADGQMVQLMAELSSTEDGIALSRQAYNDVVMRFNVKQETFPSSLIAGMFGFTRADLFRVENEAARQAPKVEF